MTSTMYNEAAITIMIVDPIAISPPPFLKRMINPPKRGISKNGITRNIHLMWGKKDRPSNIMGKRDPDMRLE